MNVYKKFGTRYPCHTMRQATNLYLRSQNVFKFVRNLPMLPQRKIVKNKFRKLGPAHSLRKCSTAIKSMFENLEETEKHCKILAGKIHIKPGGQYQRGYLKDFSVDEPENPARTLLALMVAPLIGQPSFVARLMPIFLLKCNFLFD